MKIRGGVVWRNLFGAMVFAFSVITAQFVNIPMAFAAGATLNWTGTAGDNKFSTAGNWSTNAVPTTGDTIVFLPVANNNGSTTILNNDLTNVNLAGLTYGSTSTSTFTSYQISDLQFADNATIKRTGDWVGLSVAGPVAAAGSMTLDGTTAPFYAVSQNVDITPTNLTVKDVLCGGGSGGGDPEFTVNFKPSGTVTVNGATYFPVGTESAINVASNGSLYAFGTKSFSMPITLAGGAGHCDNGTILVYGDVTLSGTLTLNGNAKYSIYANKKLTITGAINGPSYALTAQDGSTGTFVNSSSANNSKTPSGTIETPVTTLPPVTDSKPTEDYTVLPKTIATLDGQRARVDVYSGGELRGIGIASELYVSDDAIVAPGHSPGRLTILNSFNLGGTYRAEIQDKSNYDQLKVGQDFTGNGAVLLNPGAKLELSLYGTYNLKQGDTFTIIDNASSGAVNGTFDGLAEGAQITTGSAVFSISYVGGDGNDVVLTALKTVAAPTTPNTGALRFDMANPVVIAVVGVAAAAVVFVAMRRFAKQ